MRRIPNHGSARPDKFPLRIKNVSGEDIPQCGIVKITGASDVDDSGRALIYNADKPDGSDGSYWIVAAKVPDEKYGAATNGSPVIAAYDDAHTPAVDEEWGPVSGSWLLSKDGKGFRILGGVDTDNALVRVEKIGGGGGEIGVRYARVTTAISAASDNLAANWGTGGVKFMDDTTGVLDADETTVTNKLIGQSFVVDAEVEISGGFVINGTCSAVTWSDG